MPPLNVKTSHEPHFIESGLVHMFPATDPPQADPQQAVQQSVTKVQITTK